MTDPMKYDDSSEGRKATPVYTGVVRYFPAALALVAKVSKFGSDKHGSNMHHLRGVSGDHGDCLVRHQIEPLARDRESNLQHACAVAWRALAQLQEIAERDHGWPVAPAADTCLFGIPPSTGNLWTAPRLPDKNNPKVGDKFECETAIVNRPGSYGVPGVRTVIEVCHETRGHEYANDRTAVKFDGIYLIQRTNAPCWKPVEG